MGQPFLLWERLDINMNCIYTLVQSLNLHNNLLQFLHGSFVDVEAILSKLIYKIKMVKNNVNHKVNIPEISN